MKKIVFILFLLSGIILTDACKKVETDPQLDMSLAVKPAITSPANGSAFVFSKENADSTITFSWSAAEYNLTDLAATSYLLQMAQADSSFETAKKIVSTSETTYTTTYGDLNKSLVTLGLEVDVAGSVKFRVVASLKSYDDGAVITGSMLDSEETNSTFTPYESGGPAEYAKLWVPGDYQGWNPAEAPNIYDFDGDGIYTGYIYFPAGGTYEFKFTSDPDWEHTNYGNGANPGELDTDPGAGNLTVPDSGGYYVEVDIENLSWTYELQNWGVIGEWLGWSEDINMIWDADNQYLWVTVENIPAAENQRFKYRANDGWDVNLGAKDPDDGTLVPGGADIPIPDGGTLTFILRFTTPEPTYELSGK
ncbi:MAG: SusE domain-containing protein [Bacteroidales bacterium]|nr:SusE domain-containing protein [Bacteroidales bacterium]MCF6342512.1 SusE domain-containing protein [Bacteroidales bacterium]